MIHEIIDDSGIRNSNNAASTVAGCKLSAVRADVCANMALVIFSR